MQRRLSVNLLCISSFFFGQNPAASDHLYIKGSGLGRNTGGHKIGVNDPDRVPGTQGSEPDGIAETVSDPGIVRDIEPGLPVSVTRGSDEERLDGGIDGKDPAGGDIGRGPGISADQNQKGVGLGRDAEGEIGRNNGIDPHPPADIA